MRRPRTSDEEYIEEVRKSVDWWLRWRLWLRLLSVCCIVGVIWLGFKLDAIIAEMETRFGDQPGRFIVWLGLVMGIKLGLLLQGAFWNYFQTFSRFRTERLLLEHVDRQRESPGDGT